MSVNKAILLGHVGKDPEVRYLDSGIAVATLSLATSEKGYTSSNGTQVPERTEWHNLVLWRGLAETVEKYVHKGDKLYVEGKIRTRSYDDTAGVKRYTTEVFVDSMELLGTKPNGGQPPVPEYIPQPAAASSDTAAAPGATAPASGKKKPATSAAPAAAPSAAPADDLPF